MTEDRRTEEQNKQMTEEQNKLMIGDKSTEVQKINMYLCLITCAYVLMSNNMYLCAYVK